ncbi:MAG TPA: hypothetical protein VLG38_07595 [Gammaproteobacteria bacterium]|nr:hypothetical protein [Gammaproteobacteria bacterium]
MNTLCEVLIALSIISTMFMANTNLLCRIILHATELDNAVLSD